MHRHIVLHARMPEAQCTYSVCTHDVWMVHTRNTQAAHMPHSPASHMPHSSHTQVCCRHAKDTHACMHATLILHMLHPHYCHAHSTYLFCMHVHYTHMQATYFCMFTSCKTLSMNAQINAELTQAIYMHTSHKHTTPTHHVACKPHMCKFTVCIQDVFMCMLLVFAACMMPIFMH
jgi:hypothetical protein